MKWLFLILKLRELKKIRLYHIIGYESWMRVMSEQPSIEDKSICYASAQEEKKQVERIENLIKNLT